MDALNTQANKVVVTGADGFIGSHLVELLVQNGFNVRAFCMYNSNGSYGWLDTIPSESLAQVEVVLGDIRDFDSVKDAFKGCHTVYHLAALIGIPYSYKAPSSYVSTNIQGTLNSLQAALDQGVSKFIQTSTSETYGSAQFVPITEDHPLVGQSPYAATKIGSDQLAMSFWRSFGLPVTILRPFNTYGPRQSLRAVIPTIIRQILGGARDIHLGSLHPTRDFNFVADTAAAFLAVAMSPRTTGQVINSASNFEISIGETARLISELMKSDIQIIADDARMRPNLSEVERLYGSNAKLIELTSWNPRYTGLNGFKKGLEKTIDWFSYQSNIDHYPRNDYAL